MTRSLAQKSIAIRQKGRKMVTSGHRSQLVTGHSWSLVTVGHCSLVACCHLSLAKAGHWSKQDIKPGQKSHLATVHSWSRIRSGHWSQLVTSHNLFLGSDHIWSVITPGNNFLPHNCDQVMRGGERDKGRRRREAERFEGVG